MNSSLWGRSVQGKLQPKSGQIVALAESSASMPQEKSCLLNEAVGKVEAADAP